MPLAFLERKSTHHRPASERESAMTKLSFSTRFYIGAAAAALATLTGTGCGNWVKASVVNTAANPTSYGSSSSSTYSSSIANAAYPNDPGYNCPSPPNVTTTGDATPYTVCPSATSGFDISIHGNPLLGMSQIYVFPVDVLSPSQFSPNLDASGNVIFASANASGGTVHLEFSSARFNAVFIVQASDAESMNWCLQNNNFDACPDYSYERFGAYDSSSSGSTNSTQ